MESRSFLDQFIPAKSSTFHGQALTMSRASCAKTCHSNPRNERNSRLTNFRSRVDDPKQPPQLYHHRHRPRWKDPEGITPTQTVSEGSNVRPLILITRQAKPKLKTQKSGDAGSSLMALSRQRQRGVMSPAVFSLLVLAYLAAPSLACYKFPPGKKNPCLGKICNFGATCQPSLDGSEARCQCPTECYRYGDNVGSKPVCGSDGKDYPNMCEMKKEACNSLLDIRVKYYGKCGRCCFLLLLF